MHDTQGRGHRRQHPALQVLPGMGQTELGKGLRPTRQGREGEGDREGLDLKLLGRAHQAGAKV